MSWSDTERAAMAETFRATDPDAPTLCEGWTVRDLLAHLVVRDQAPLRRGADMLATALGREPGHEPFQGRLAAGARTPEAYEALVQRFERGPGRLMGLPGDGVNLVEYVVHHEDVRRAGEDPAEPRTLPPDMVRAVWAHVAGFARLGMRKAPTGVVLMVPGGPRRVVRKRPDAVVLSGDPVELALYVAGRREVADVDVLGSAEAVARFEEWAGA